MLHKLHAETAISARCIRRRLPLVLKRSAVVLCLLFASIAMQAQKPGSVRWTASAARAHAGDRWIVSLKADIQPGWHIYAATQPANGPMPLVIAIEPGSPYRLAGKIDGTAPTRHHDASFNLDTQFYEDTFALTIPVEATSAGNRDVPLAVRYQMCSVTTCMPPRTVHLLAVTTAQQGLL